MEHGKRMLPKSIKSSRALRLSLEILYILFLHCLKGQREVAHRCPWPWRYVHRERLRARVSSVSRTRLKERVPLKPLFPVFLDTFTNIHIPWQQRPITVYPSQEVWQLAQGTFFVPMIRPVYGIVLCLQVLTVSLACKLQRVKIMTHTDSVHRLDWGGVRDITKSAHEVRYRQLG